MLSESKEYQIISLNFKDTQSNTKMAKLQLKEVDADSKFNCVIWQDSLDKIHKQSLRVGNTIRIKNSDYNENYNNYVIYSLELIKEAKLGLSKEEQDNLFNEIINILNSLNDVKLRNSLSRLILDNTELFKVSPAAISIHHNYVGGLMQHIWECIQIAKANFPVVMREIDHNLVIAGCITHDLGKMFEYIIDPESGIIIKNKDFQKVWINHIQWGFGWANQEGLPELAHIIASHHGTKEWNALVEPLTPEANLVHQIDMISSRLGAVDITTLEKIDIVSDLTPRM